MCPVTLEGEAVSAVEKKVEGNFHVVNFMSEIPLI